jgi:hypothetical protein
MTKRRKFVALACAAAVVPVVIVGTSAVATHTPADKVVAAGDNLTVINEGTNQTILTATIKSSKPSDLMMHVAAECAVETTHMRDGKTSSNQALGSARVWIEIDGKIVPIMSSSAPPQDPAQQPGGGEDDKVTFCHREEGFSKTDNNALCTAENPVPPLTNQCEMEEWFQNTKTANAFNWVRLNVGSGNHTITVKADVVEESTASAGDTSESQAYIGNRSLIVEPTKMSNDTLVLTSGTS